MTIQLYPRQESLVANLRTAMRSYKRVILQAPCGFGKCLGRGTRVLMFDGSTKKAEEISVGDLLIGPDSMPRVVTALGRGREMMYRIKPNKGDSWTCNESHILSLKTRKVSCGVKSPTGRCVQTGDISNVTVREYLDASKHFRITSQLWRNTIDFVARPEPLIPAYIMGVWVGDGTSRSPAITTGDKCIQDAWIEYGKSVGLKSRTEANSNNSVVVHITNNRSGGVLKNPFVVALRKYGIENNKKIVDDYKLGSRQTRLDFLAGVLDTDGEYFKCTYSITQKKEEIADAIRFISLSLGLQATKRTVEKKCFNNGKVGTYYRIVISGNVDQIPCRVSRKIAAKRVINKNVLTTGFSIEAIGFDDYFGFEIAGNDRLFLLGDFTVTHNTVLASYIAKAVADKNKKIVFATHRKQILKQTIQTFLRNEIPYGKIGRDAQRPVMVGTMPALRNRMEKLPADVVFIDEGHIYAAGFEEVHEYYSARGAWIIAMTATPSRYGNRGMGKFYDHIVLGPSVRELIDDGSLSDYVLYAPPGVDTSELHVKNGEYVQAEAEALMDKPTITGDAIATWRQRADGLRTITFCVSVEHSRNVAAAYNAAGIAAAHMDANTPDHQREAAIADFADGRVKILCNCALATEGFDLSAQVGRDVPIEAVQCLKPTKSLPLFIQMMSRGLRRKPTKAVLLDHVGLTAEFGTVDMDREWSLEDRPRKKKNPPTYTCQSCFGTFAEAFDICPACGAVKEVKGGGRIEPDVVDGELKEVDAAAIRERKRPVYDMARRRANTLDELKAYAREKGYKEGWAVRIYEIRNNKLKRA